MEARSLLLGRIAGLVGLLLVVASVLLRLGGVFMVGNFQTGTLLMAGVAGLATGCFFLLWSLTVRSR
jgi:hypothetical protein